MYGGELYSVYALSPPINYPAQSLHPYVSRYPPIVVSHCCCGYGSTDPSALLL